MSPLIKAFCLDTSFFINGWHKHYRPDVFPAVWDMLDKLIRQGRLCSCREIYEDLKRQDDDLFAWAKSRKNVFHEPKKTTVAEVTRILNKYPSYAATGGTISRSDPWIIAHACTTEGIVVTDETPSPRQRPTLPPKMPDVCDALQIPWRKPIDFLAEAGLRL